MIYKKRNLDHSGNSLSRLIRIRRSVLETRGDLLTLRLIKRRIIIIIIIITIIIISHQGKKIINKKKEKKRKRAVVADPKVKIKENEKRDKYLDLAKELKKLWNMRMTEIPIVTGALGTVSKSLEKGLDELEIEVRIETFQITTLLRSTRILRRVLQTCGDLLSLRLHQLALVWKTRKKKKKIQPRHSIWDFKKL